MQKSAVIWWLPMSSFPIQSLKSPKSNTETYSSELSSITTNVRRKTSIGSIWASGQQNPKSLINKYHGLLKQYFARITIQMWNAEMRDKVLERPRSTPGLSHLKLREDDICFMPHEDVQLVCKSDISQSIRLLQQPTSLLVFAILQLFR